jgi:hypothetical protein
VDDKLKVHGERADPAWPPLPGLGGRVLGNYDPPWRAWEEGGWREDGCRLGLGIWEIARVCVPKWMPPASYFIHRDNRGVGGAH